MAEFIDIKDLNANIRLLRAYENIYVPDCYNEKNPATYKAGMPIWVLENDIYYVYELRRNLVSEEDIKNEFEDILRDINYHRPETNDNANIDVPDKNVEN